MTRRDEIVRRSAERGDEVLHGTATGPAKRVTMVNHSRKAAETAIADALINRAKAPGSKLSDLILNRKPERNDHG